MLHRLLLTAFFYLNRHYVYNLLTWYKQVTCLYRVTYTYRAKFVLRPVQKWPVFTKPLPESSYNRLNK